MEHSGETKGSDKSGTTGSKGAKPPVDTTRVSYSELEHSGTTTGNKGVKKPAVDTAYEPVDHNKKRLPPIKRHKPLLLGHCHRRNSLGASLEMHLSSEDAVGRQLFT